jgi:methylmalonyl-CoA epimerase
LWHGPRFFLGTCAQDTIEATMRILRIRHLTLAVRDIDAARAAFETLFGADASAAADVAAFGARTQDVTLGESTVEFASPIERDGALQRFIERRGEGVYTVALEVADLDAAVAELTARGVRVSDPVEATPGLRSAFVAMSATHGMSVQLVQDLAPVGGIRSGEPEGPSPRPPSLGGKGQAEADAPDPAEITSAGATPSEPKEIDLTPDGWSGDEWSDTD